MAFTFQRDIILWTLQQQKRQRQRQTALKYCFEFSHNSRLSFGLSCCLQIDQTLLLFFAGLQWGESPGRICSPEGSQEICITVNGNFVLRGRNYQWNGGATQPKEQERGTTVDNVWVDLLKSKL